MDFTDISMRQNSGKIHVTRSGRCYHSATGQGLSQGYDGKLLILEGEKNTRYIIINLYQCLYFLSTHLLSSSDRLCLNGLLKLNRSSANTAHQHFLAIILWIIS